MTNLEVLQKCTVENNVVKLPEMQLDRKLYLQVKKDLELIGGKWKGGKVAGFVFPIDPTELLAEIAGGEKRNLKKEYQFFETQPAVIEKMRKHIDLELPRYSNEPVYYLEPSAGQGALLEVLVEEKHAILTIHYLEKMKVNQSILKKKFSHEDNVHFIGDDFLKIDERYSNFYNLIFANPPFAKNQDIKHLKKMYDVCSAGGTIVCIMSTGWFYNSGKVYDEFREWIGFKPYMSDTQIRAFANSGSTEVISRTNDYGMDEQVLIEMVKEGEFKKSGTNVPTCIVVIHKK